MKMWGKENSLFSSVCKPDGTHGAEKQKQTTQEQKGIKKGSEKKERDNDKEKGKRAKEKK